MTTFHLLHTRSGKLLVTTETKMKPEEMDQAAAVLKLWSEGPETGVLLIPDCVFELEVVDDEVTLVGPAVAREAVSHPPVAPEPKSPLYQPLADRMVALMRDAPPMRQGLIAGALNADLEDVRMVLRVDPRFCRTVADQYRRDAYTKWVLVPSGVPTATP